MLDGHGGDWCSLFLRQRFEAVIRENLLDPVEGLYGTERTGLSDCVQTALKKSFFYLDELYHT